MPVSTGQTPAERLLRRYVAAGKELNLRTDISGQDAIINGQYWGRERIIRAHVLSDLIRGEGAVAEHGSHAIRLTGARIVDRLDLAGVDIGKVLRLKFCYFEEMPDLTDSRTRSIHLNQCCLPGLDAERARVEGQLDLREALVHGRLALVNAHISGELTMNRARLINPDGWTLFAGGLTVDGAVFGRRGVESHGAIRLNGAKLNGGLFLDHARIVTKQDDALVADNLKVAGRMVCDQLVANGSIRLPGARIDGQMTWNGARILARDIALDLRRVTAQELILTMAQPQGVVDLRNAQVTVIADDPTTWPSDLRLDGLSYESLITATGANQFFNEARRYVSDIADSQTAILPAKQRVPWLQRNTVGYRPQPYEQLAAFYRRMGHDDQARVVLLAKQRQRRITQNLAGKVWSYLLDWSVGYGYRPWRAAIWLAFLVVTGTVVFHLWPPKPINPGKTPEFSSFAYTVNILLPIGQFVQPDSWSPVGAERWFAYGLVAAGWLLATAVIAGVTRVLNRS